MVSRGQSLIGSPAYPRCALEGPFNFLGPDRSLQSRAANSTDLHGRNFPQRFHEGTELADHTTQKCRSGTQGPIPGADPGPDMPRGREPTSPEARPLERNWIWATRRGPIHRARDAERLLDRPASPMVVQE
jgi:hypothetical protein